MFLRSQRIDNLNSLKDNSGLVIRIVLHTVNIIDNKDNSRASYIRRN